ncbi:hypothetical protein FHG87_017796 [Trinorchestia longiramus]|nr:hypothetical protein FHG87_017796 [Trinorchestia longiramus]
MRTKTSLPTVIVAGFSTVIPLDELRTFTVSSILGPASEEPPAGVTKPSKPTKLITAARKKSILPEKKTSITEITKEEFSKH